jgi:hypothetical protein
LTGLTTEAVVLPLLPMQFPDLEMFEGLNILKIEIPEGTSLLSSRPH